MAGKKQERPTVTTTANLIEKVEEADNTASSLFQEPTPEDARATFVRVQTELGHVRMIAQRSMLAYGAGNRNYRLDKGEEVWVHKENVDYMLRANAIRHPKAEE